MRKARPLILFACLSLLSAVAGTSPAIAVDPVTVKFQAQIVAGAKALLDDIQWSITPADKSGTPAQSITKAQPELPLLPGKYRVTAKLGFVSASKDVTVSEPGREVVVLNGGYTRLAMIPDRKAKPLEDNILWQIYMYRKDGADEKTKVTEVVAPSPQFTLVPGYYIVRCKYQGVAAETVVEVKPGILYKYTVVAYAGKVMLSAIDGKGKAVKNDVEWSIERVGKDKSAPRTPVVTDKTATPKLLLVEGKYVVVAKSGNLVGETPFEIKQADTKAVKVQLKPVGGA